MGSQMLYSERPGPVDGYSEGLTPDVEITFDSGDRIAGAFGVFYDQNGWQVITNLGFWMASGKQYGPYGDTINIVSPYNAFSTLGIVRGIFGTAWDNNRALTGIGYWMESAAPPPSPPARPPPPLTPPPPRSLYNWGRVKAISSGYLGNVQWDDGAFYSGEPCLDGARVLFWNP